MNKNVFVKSSSYVLCDLNYNLKLKKVFDFFSILKSKKFLLVFNPYKNFVNGLQNSFDKDLSFVAIPSLNPIEFKGVYLNLEERPQETQSLKDVSNVIILKNSLIEFF